MFKKLLPAVLAFSGYANASTCDVDINYGLLINDEHIRVMDQHRTKLQINNDNQLFIEGEWITLNQEDTQLLQAFSLGLRREVPEIVNIAMEGVAIGLQAIDRVVYGLTGGNTSEGVSKHFEEIKFRLKQKFNRTEDHFYIAPQSLDELSDFFEDELADEIKNIVTSSLGSIMVALGEAMRSDENTLESSITDVGERVDMINEEIERSLVAKNKSLEAKADQFCQRLRELNKFETELQQHVPQLNNYDILTISTVEY